MKLLLKNSSHDAIKGALRRKSLNRDHIFDPRDPRHRKSFLDSPTLRRLPVKDLKPLRTARETLKRQSQGRSINELDDPR
jgi:hypothetical protein